MLQQFDIIFKKMFEESPIGIEIYDADGHLVEINKACLDIFGVTNILDVKGFDLFNDLNISSEIKKKLRNGEIARYEVPFDFEKVKKNKLYNTTKSGIIFLDVLISPLIFYENNILSAYLVQVQDITERKIIENDLKNSEKKFRQLIETMNEGLGILNKEGIITFANDRLCNILSYKQNEVIGKRPTDFLDEKNIEIWNEQMIKRKKGVKKNYEIILNKKDGSKINILIAPELLFDEYSNFNGSFAIFTDITNLKIAESLRESEQNFRTLAENANEGIIIATGEGNHAYANKMAAKITGYSISELLNLTMKDLAHPDEVEEIKKRYKKIKNGISMLKQYETKIIRKDGKNLFLEITGAKTLWMGQSAVLIIFRDISKRKKAEEKLMLAYEELNQIFNVASGGMRVIDKDFNNIRVNEIFLDLTGRKKDEIIGRKCFDIFPGPHCHTPNCALTQIFSGTERIESEIEKYRVDGTKIPCILTATPFRNPEGEIIGIVENFKDITERKQAEEVLRAERNKLETLTRNIGVGLAIISKDYKTLWANRVIKGIFGDVEGVSCYIAYNKRSEICPGCGVKEIFETGKDRVVHEQKGKDMKGDTIWSQVIATPIKDEQGNIISALEAVVPITERKLAEEQLRESEKKFRNISEQLLIGICIIQDNSIMYVNEAMSKINEDSIQDLMNMTVKDLFNRIHPEDITVAQERLKRFNAKKKNAPYNIYKMITKSGKKKWVEIYSNSIVYRGKPAVLTTILDISEKKKSEEKLKKLQEELLEKNKLAALGQLAAGVAHELNTPLANINLTADYIIKLFKMKRISSDFNILEDEIVDIKSQVQFCAQIVKNLLQFSRKINLNLKRFELNSLLSELIESPSISSKLREKNIQIILEQDKPIEIDGDKTLLSQVFSNILNNSIDALEDKKIKPEIKIILSKKNNEALIKMIDNGKGIKESDFSRIFEPFFSTKQVGKGTGLGLSISRGIIEKHNGKITINSILGKGTEVLIILPLTHSLTKKKKIYKEPN